MLKKYDVLELLDEKISQEENVFIESVPNKIPFIKNNIKPYLLIEYLMLFTDFLYFLVRPGDLTGTAQEFLALFDVIIMTTNFVPLFFLFRSIYFAVLKVVNTYYVVTDLGIHVVEGGRSINYDIYRFTDIKSFNLSKYPLSKSKGDIIFKDSAEKEYKTFTEKFFKIKKGLIAIDEAEKVYNILKQIALQENPNIFFSDDDIDTKVDYFRDVKRYNKKIVVDKDDSIMKRRNN